MFVALVGQDKKSWLLEASDGRRFIISGKENVTVCPEGSHAPIFGGRGLSYRAARGLLEEVLGKELAA
jgi:hypothetical protein